jgi:hypothetical protein
LKRQNYTIETQQGEVPKSLGPDGIPLSSTEQLPVEAQRKSFQSLELDVTQSSSVDQSLVIVSALLISLEDHTPPDEGTSTAVCESVEHSVLLPSSVEPADHPRRTKEEKGKDKVGDDRPIVPLVERSEASLSSNLMANRAEDETRESFPREETEGKQPVQSSC